MLRYILCLILSIEYLFADEYVTLNSVVKLINVNYQVRLHSHDIKYGSGSGQQSVTGVESKEDQNSYWVLLNQWRNETIRGLPIKCNTVITLKHLVTKHMLHSHDLYESPLSNNQEVSAYKTADEKGDSGDNWEVICRETIWNRNTVVLMKHVDTGRYLCVSGKTYNRPISNQKEVCSMDTSSKSCQWKAMEGAYFLPSDDTFQMSDPVISSETNPHDEL